MATNQRQEMASRILAGLLSNEHYLSHKVAVLPDDFCEIAVEDAERLTDMLLERLDTAHPTWKTT